MDRIAIVGCGGSGKSVLACQLGDRLGHPVIHLDGIYYDESWNTLALEDFAARQRDLVAKERWIIDGNYASTLPIRLTAADTVIFLDLPPAACLWGIARRRVQYGGGQPPETGVYDRFNLRFVRYVLSYRRMMVDVSGHRDVTADELLVVRRPPAERGRDLASRDGCARCIPVDEHNAIGSA